MGYKDDNYSTKVCGHHPETCTCRDWDTKEEPKEEHCECKRAYKEALSGICELCWNEKYPTKQETLEEAAANLADPNICKTDNWIAGAKWQAESLFTKETYSTIESLVISWANDGTRTSGDLTREIIGNLKKEMGLEDSQGA